MSKKNHFFIAFFSCVHGLLFSMKQNQVVTSYEIQEIIKKTLKNQDKSSNISKTVHPSKLQLTLDSSDSYKLYNNDDDFMNKWEESEEKSE